MANDLIEQEAKAALERTCLDDSCDGSHCSCCGGHFFDFYLHTHARQQCSSCETLEEDEEEAVRAAVKAKWQELYGNNGESKE
jgi:hypothetical protein